MRSRLSIFSSRVLKSACFWTLILIIGLEGLASRDFPKRFVNHIVDTRLHDLTYDTFNHPILLLGDSVADQMGPGLEKDLHGRLHSMATMMMIETTGQYFMLERYLARNPAPETVLLIMDLPLRGNLATTYTENYFQRCFLRWSEIGRMAMAKRDPVFTATHIAYKLFPSLRYRTHLQNGLPWFALSSTVGGLPPDEIPIHKQPEHGLLGLVENVIGPSPTAPPLSEQYFMNMVELTARHGIRLVVAIRPIPEKRRHEFEQDGIHGRQMRRLGQIQQDHPHVRFVTSIQSYPNDWFRDGIHLETDRIDPAVKDYVKRLKDVL